MQMVLRSIPLHHLGVSPSMWEVRKVVVIFHILTRDHIFCGPEFLGTPFFFSRISSEPTQNQMTQPTEHMVESTWFPQITLNQCGIDLELMSVKSGNLEIG